jgi:hypothetical protein
MVDLLLYVLFFALLAVAALGGYWMLRGTLDGQSPMVALFGTRPEKRLAVVEHASVDGRRRLVLVRRDNVEHLIMTGGPVDVVIETGIENGKPAAPAPADEAERDETKSASWFGGQSRAARATQSVAE